MRRTLAGFGVAGVLLAGFVYLLDPAAVWGTIAGTDLAVFALGPVAVLLAVACWSEALRALLGAADHPASVRGALVAYGTGTFGKQVLPMGHAGGPALMSYAVDREVSAGYDRTLAVVTVAEFLSLVASLLLAMAGAAVLLASAPEVPEVRLLAGGSAPSSRGWRPRRRRSGTAGGRSSGRSRGWRGCSSGPSRRSLPASPGG